MSALMNPQMGFYAAASKQADGVDEKLNAKLTRSGADAARRKFTPEFITGSTKSVVKRSVTPN
jgi:hypothetical protein